MFGPNCLKTYNGEWIEASLDPNYSDPSKKDATREESNVENGWVDSSSSTIGELHRDISTLRNIRLTHTVETLLRRRDHGANYLLAPTATKA